MHRSCWPHRPYTVYMAVHQAKDRQTVQNVNEKYTPSPSAAAANAHRPSNCSTSNKGRCMVHTLAGAAGAWFIQTVGLLTKYETQHKSDRNSSSAQRYDGASTKITVYDMIWYNMMDYIVRASYRQPYNIVYHITNIFYKYRRCTNFVRVSQTQTTTLTRYAFVSILFCC